jgi:hypothetical protein
MAKNTGSSPLRIPVRFLGGVWECAHGGKVPVSEGTEAELKVSRHRITDPVFAAAFEAKEKYRILDEGAPLLIAVTIRSETPPPPNLSSHLIPYKTLAPDMPFYEMFGLGLNGLHFVQVRIAGPNNRQRLDLGTQDGGLWLFVSGTRIQVIRSTTIILPPGVGERAAQSLNHALTMLSEVYEQWRISHTGNIYERVFYQTSDRHWFPLALLREATVGEHDDLIAGRLSEGLSERMNARRDKKRRK